MPGQVPPEVAADRQRDRRQWQHPDESARWIKVGIPCRKAGISLPSTREGQQDDIDHEDHLGSTGEAARS